MQQASVSLSVLNQLPDFIKDNSPLFERFLSHYYKSQEKVAGPIGVLNNLSDYFNLSKYDLTKLDGNTSLIASISDDTSNIEVETTDGFVENNGTILIDDEIIYYESLKKSPSVILSAGLSYPEFQKKILELTNPYQEFDGIKKQFDLKLNNVPVFPPSSQHVLVKIYNEYLTPEVDYTILGDKLIFTTAPRQFDAINLSDTITDISIRYLKGYDSNNIDILDNITPGTNNEVIYPLRKNNSQYIPASTVLTVAIVDGRLLVPLQDYSVFNDYVIFKEVPQQSIYISYISAPIVNYGSGAVAYSVVNTLGEVEKIQVKFGGSGYTLANSPKVSITGSSGQYATAKSLVGGLKTVTLLEGGKGYSEVNPPIVVISSPAQSGSTTAQAKATVNASGNISSITLTNSGSGYETVPRIQFVNPTGAEVNNPIVSNGAILSIDVVDGGFGYTTAPEIYIDPPQQENGIQAAASAVLDSDGHVIDVIITVPGTGYDSTTLPRVKVIQPTGAQILDVSVDDFGRVINIELLSGGFGYEDVPSVYIVDDRKDNLGNAIGGTGAKAVATIFNGEIIDINIVDFGTGYSSQYPPKVFISSSPSARASSEIGIDEVTGFELVNTGSEYVKSQFVNCARGVSGLLKYDTTDNLVFKSESESIASYHNLGSTVTSVDSIFLKKIIDKITSGYLPNFPELDTNQLNVSNIISTIKDFYASKGTVYSVKYLFKLLYGASVDVTYPKDQIIKPSAASWSIDTILRCKIVSGNPLYLKDSLLEQVEDAVDTNVLYASALIENYTAIQTSKYDVYELILSEETIQGKFVIPYTTKLVQSITPEVLVIDVDSTIGWPERNGEVVIGNEIIRYKEKSLTQFIECTRGISGSSAQNWDAGSTVESNFYIYANRGTDKEVVLSILGIIDANQTNLIDDGSYYLSGDKLAIAKLGADDNSKIVTSWLYNVKKLLKVDTIIYGGVNNQTATVTCFDPHGLLVGDQVTIYGANPIVYNGSFLVTSRESETVFKYTLPQPAVLNPQGNILISIDLNTGKSDTQSINTSISRFPSNIQNTFINSTDVYVAASGIPNYKIGPFIGTALLPGNQRKLYKFPRIANTISLKTSTIPGPVGSFVNGVSIWNYKSQNYYEFGPVTNINVINSGQDYDAATPPILSFEGGNGFDASAEVIVNGSVVEIEVIDGGSGYTSAPLVSIYGSDGIGASATAVVTNGVVSRVLMNSVGTGYTKEPTVTITGGGGSGATARSVVRGPIKSVNLTNPGTSYTSAPQIKLSSGQGAAAQAYVSNGRILSIAIIAAGVGYTTAPKVIITGDGFGAVAKATISSEGTSLGKVVSIQILNRGIGYNQGTTQIRLESIGSDAVFESEIYRWTFNLNETTNFDYANGSIFVGYNSQYGGEYAHISNPKQLRYVLGDNLDLISGELQERDSVTHSPILGWAFDGNPIYGPYGFQDPTSLSSSIVPIRSSYSLKTNLIYDENTNPSPSRIEGPLLSEYPAGTFTDDYEYNFNSLATYLDEYNGRFTKTPEFPDGIYAYFVTLDPAGVSEYPYIIGPKYYSSPDLWNLNQFATQSYIPSGVVRYRAPFENVDIDVERIPNQTTNALTLENGDLLLFEIEDENKDGIISQDEIDDPDVMFEEQKLEVFDYFPKVDIASKVDIEVETTTKFEDAKITGFLIENSGQNYQVNDRLVFDDTNTGGYGASARIAEIEGKTIQSYNYEYDSNLDEFKGVLQTTEPHDLLVGDTVNVTTTPLMEPSSKTISVRSVTGIEKIIIEQEGVGYDPDIEPFIDIESNSGQHAQLNVPISSTGIISNIEIVNSGTGYLEDPIIRISHPESKKKADYFYDEIYEDNYKLVPYNTLVTTDKSFYVMGSKVDISNETGDSQLSDKGYFTKYNSDGVLIYGKVFNSPLPTSNTSKFQFVAAAKNLNNLYVVGRTYPNQTLTAAFNPDVFVCRFVENSTGSDATLSWKIDLAGISGITRSDYVTSVACIGDNILIAGYTNTNTVSSDDGFIVLLNSSGDVLSKRKITSSSLSEKIYEIKVDSNNNIFVVGSSNTNNILVTKLYVLSNSIKVSWSKTYSLSGYKFTNISFIIDEYDQLYLTSTPEVVSTGNRERIQLLRLNNSGEIVYNLITRIGSNISTSATNCSIDIFGHITVAYSIVDSNLSKSFGVLKYKYDGTIINSYTIEDQDLTRGYTAISCVSDSSGDQIIVGTVEQNRTQFLFNAEGNAFDDKTGRSNNLVDTGDVYINYGDGVFDGSYYSPQQNAKLSVDSLTADNNNWTIEEWIKWDSLASAKEPILIRATDGVNGVKVVVHSDTTSPGTLLLSNDSGTVTQQTTANTYATDLVSDWVHLSLTKEYVNGVTTYALNWNGTEIATISENLNMNPTDIEFGSTTSYSSWPMNIDDIRYSNYIVSTVPNDPYGTVDYGTASGNVDHDWYPGRTFMIKCDKNSDSVRLGNITLSNNNLVLTRNLYSVMSSDFNTDLISSNYLLAGEGFQILDFSYTTASSTTSSSQQFENYRDIWSSRTATVPSTGGKKVKVSAKVLDKFYFKYFNASKIDNVVKLTLNQDFNYNIGTTLIQYNNIGSTIATGKIVEKDLINNTITVSDRTGSFSLNTGRLESSDLYTNEIDAYVFANVDNTVLGSFDLAIPVELSAEFKDYSEEDYLIRIDNTVAGSPYTIGSVVTITSSQISFTSDKQETTITGLTGVSQISVITNLKRIIQVDSIDTTDLIFVRSDVSHYLTADSIVYCESSPQYESLDGTFDINTIISKKEFIVKLRSNPTSELSTEIVSIFVKTPIFKFIYGQQYTFDTSDSSMQGHYLSFYRDNLYKIEYTFKNIIRKGTPGFDEPGNSPFISFKVTDDVANISYYADPSNLTEDGPVSSLSYIDILPSPYIGNFEITDLSGGSITEGPNVMKFVISFEPEKAATTAYSSYSTTSPKAVGSISRIRLVNGGGFYKKLPIIRDIQSSRKIERVDIVNPGTEYEAGEYFGVPILGDGTGGKVSILVDGTSDPAGQIIEVTVTDPGKGYTTAYIDVDAIDGILGPELLGSGAELTVVIPPKGTGASIFTQGENVGKIKKLKNNNFGFNYTHDYTLRPEITFPVNLQLINTSILSSIKIVDPGTGYTTPPEVVITGGGGSGASAQALIKNGRISDIIIKNPGYGYSSSPDIQLKSSFTYVVNLDLGLFQFAFPHGIQNGATVQFQVQDLGEGASFPLTSFGFISQTQLYYAISGGDSGLEDNQLRIALTPQDALSGNYISFANAGTGRQIILTDSFGGSAVSVVETGRFLSGELIYQGDSLENASATGYVSVNDGWQIGPRLLKVTNVDGEFTVGLQVTGVVSRASGTIQDINIAKGVLEVDSITKTVGKFIDDIGKPSEIVQRIQDSYLYQTFSYNIKSPVSIGEWRDTLIESTHPAGFKVFGEIDIAGGGKGLNDRTDFELTKSVNLIESSVVANIENFALVEPIYQEFDNTQVLFRSTRLTSSEEILTSVVQRLDDISNLFDGERTSFPLTIDGNTVIANTSQFMIVINGISQAPGQTFEVQQGNIVFNEPPAAPTKVSYAKATLLFLSTYQLNISNVSGILPELGNSIRGLTSNTVATIVSSTSNTLKVFDITGAGFQDGETIISSVTGLNCTLDSQEELVNANVFEFGEKISNTKQKTAKVEEINLDTETSTVTNNIIISKTSGTYESPSGLLEIALNDYILGAKSGVVAKIVSISPYQDPATGEFISSITISDQSSFFGLLFNRIVNPVNPNVIVDDISKSLAEVVDINDFNLKAETKFVPYEDITNIVLDFDYNVGSDLVIEDDLIQNIEISYINETGSFAEGETFKVKKLSYYNLSGGNFNIGETVTGSISGAYAEIIGINYALKIIFVGSTTGSFNLGEEITNGSGVSAISSNYNETPFIGNQIDVGLDTIITGQIDEDTQHRYRDAANLLRLNSTYIIDEAAGRMKSRYPDLVIPGDIPGSVSDGTNRCKLDLSLLLNAVITDIENGGSYESITAARFYINAEGGLNYIQLQALQSLYAHTQMSELCQQAISGELSLTPLYTDVLPIAPIGIQIDPSSPFCANVRSNINSLWEQINDIIAPAAQIYRDAADQLWFNRDYIAQEATGYIESYFTYILNGTSYSGFTYPNGSPTVCERDITDYIIPSIITDLLTGGNANIISAMEYYIGNGNIQYVKDELLPTVVAIEKVNQLCQYAIDNWIINGTTATEYNTTYGATASKYKDLTIIPDDGTYGGNCERIKASVDTLFNIAVGILIPERNSYYGRYYDASNLIESNKTLIAEVAVGRMLANYPGFSVPNGNQNCIDDIVDILTALVYDLRNGGNARTFDYAQVYTINSYLSGEQTQSNYAFNQARDMAIEAMRNEVITIGGYSTLSQYFDNTVIGDQSGQEGVYTAGDCANVASSITTLTSILTTAVTNGNMNHVTRQSESDSNKLYRDAAKLILFNKEYIKYESLQGTLNNYAGFSVPGGNAKCLRDIGYVVNAIVYDLLTDGNSAIIEAATSYIDATTGTVLSLEGELIQSIYTYNRVKDYLKQAVSETLTSPATASGQYAYTDASVSISGASLTEIQNFIDDEMDILLGVLNNPDYIDNNSIVSSNSITVPSKSYPVRIRTTPISNEIAVGDYIYGETSGEAGEIESIIYNRGTVRDIYLRFEIDYTTATEVFQVNQELTVQGQPSVTCNIISIENGEFVSYIDVLVNQGPFNENDVLLNPVNFTATITSIVNRVQLTNVIGGFASNQYAKGLYSHAEIGVTNYDYNYAPVISNTGSKLILETEAISGEFLPTRRVYSSLSSYYIDVINLEGLSAQLGDVIQTTNTYRLTLSLLDENLTTFPVGEKVQNVFDNLPLGREATVINYEILPGGSTAYLYIGNIVNDDIFQIGDLIAYYVPGDQYPSGYAEVSSVLTTPSAAYGRIEKITSQGSGYRYYLSEVTGTFNLNAQVVGSYGYKSIISNVVKIEGSISRYFLGFNGTQTTFKLTTNNGDQYFPDSDGHMLVFVNGILQPPGTSYTAYSDTIQFSEAPDSGGSFNAVYVGKLRQLDDIGFEFDSLRNSFNLKLNEVFYSLTLTAGVQSTTIKPENNIIVSLNGVIQEPGVSFQLVGSRIIFAEVPRAGSTFVAFSYIGSDADVIAATVIPPIEAGDQLEIQSEDQSRTVAVIESSNSLITFDYLGSVLGRNAEALASIITGRVSKLQLTSGGNGYTSRPTVAFDSATGFDAQAKALVGISRIDVVNRGSNYNYPSILVDTYNPGIDPGFGFKFDDDDATFDNVVITFDQA